MTAPTTSNSENDPPFKTPWQSEDRIKYQPIDTSNISNAWIDQILNDVFAGLTKFEKEQCFPEAKQALTAYLKQGCDRARVDSKLQKAIDMSGNEFAMGYDDSGCFWRFYYGNRGAGSMMEGWPRFDSESPEVGEALDEFIEHLNQGGEDEKSNQNN